VIGWVVIEGVRSWVEVHWDLVIHYCLLEDRHSKMTFSQVWVVVVAHCSGEAWE
jgi:hypothetical protein